MNALKATAYTAINLDQITKDSECWDTDLRERAAAVGKIIDKMNAGNVTTRTLSELATAVTAYVEYKHAQANR